MRRSIVIGTLLTLMVLLVAGCGGDDDAASLEGTRWVLDSIDDGTASVPVVEGTEPYLEFTGDTVAGSDGCNQITGSVTVGPDDAIAFGGDMAGTLMACPEPVMDQAAAIVGLLAEASTYAVDDSTLTLTSGGGSLVYVAG
jgi:heat shock protein HslJ